MNHSEHLIITCAENCGNSPKKQLLKDLSIAFAKNQLDICFQWMTDDVVWDIIGDKRIQGKSDFQKQWNLAKGNDVQQITIHNIITHGNSGSVNGTLIHKDEKKTHFCHIFNFSGFGKNAKIKQMTSYIIK